MHSYRAAIEIIEGCGACSGRPDEFGLQQLVSSFSKSLPICGTCRKWANVSFNIA